MRFEGETYVWPKCCCSEAKRVARAGGRWGAEGEDCDMIACSGESVGLWRIAWVTGGTGMLWRCSFRRDGLERVRVKAKTSY